MAVNTKQVQGRRRVNYESLDDLVQDAERMASVESETLGNWSLGQIFSHLAKSIDHSMDGYPFNAPWSMRFVMRTFLKGRLLTKTLPPGFKIPSKAASMVPEDETAEGGLSELRAAVHRLQSNSQRVPNPLLEELSLDEWNQFHLRHAEMHMSFVRPRE